MVRSYIAAISVILIILAGAYGAKKNESSIKEQPNSTIQAVSFRGRFAEYLNCAGLYKAVANTIAKDDLVLSDYLSNASRGSILAASVPFYAYHFEKSEMDRIVSLKQDAYAKVSQIQKQWEKIISSKSKQQVANQMAICEKMLNL